MGWLADWRCRCGRRSRWWLEGRGGGGVDGRGGGSSSSRIDEKSIVLRQDYSSAKIKAVIEIIQEHCRPGISYRCNGGSENASSSSGHAEGPIKAIVFSQWTRMLDLVEMSLNQYCLEYRRLDETCKDYIAPHLLAK